MSELSEDIPEVGPPEHAIVIDLAAKRSAKRTPKANRAPWLANAIRDERGRPTPNLANTMIGLREAPEIADAFAFDEMLRAPLIVHGLPSIDDASDQGPFPRPVRDTD